MAIDAWTNLITQTVQERIHVVRFLRPDLREQLEEDGDDNALLRELRMELLPALHEGDTVVLNLGLVEIFPTAFYACLLRFREAVLTIQAHLLLCRLSEEHQEIFRLFNAHRLFHVLESEAHAVSYAKTLA
jgi:anti-anti-sigma regulatory factor